MPRNKYFRRTYVKKLDNTNFNTNNSSATDPSEALAERGEGAESLLNIKEELPKDFKGVEDECLYRALTLTIRPPKEKSKISTDLEDNDYLSEGDIDGSNYSRLLATLPTVYSLLTNNCRKFWFTFELGSKGNLHYHCYLKLKSNCILRYRNSLYNWTKQYGFTDDKPSRSEKGRKIWRAYLVKEWKETQEFFFGEVYRTKALRFGGGPRLLDYLRKKGTEHEARVAEAHDKPMLPRPRTIDFYEEEGEPNIEFEG